MQSERSAGYYANQSLDYCGSDGSNCVDSCIGRCEKYGTFCPPGKPGNNTNQYKMCFGNGKWE